MTPHIGVLLPSRQPAATGNPAAAVLVAAQRAEAARFDSVWVGDSLVARPRLEPITALGAVAAVTSSVQVGTAVLLAAMRPPVPTAHALATVDLIAGGRLIVGVGAGASVTATEDDFRAASADYAGRVRRLYDTVTLWRALWAGAPAPGPSSFPGLAGVRLEPRPVQEGGPPVWLAGEGAQTLRHAGRDFDGWLPFSASPATFAAGAETVRGASRSVGRNGVVLAAYLTVTIDDDPDRATRVQAAFVESYYGVPYDFMRAVQGYAAGTAREVAEWLSTYVARGATHLVLRLAGDNFTEQLDRATDVAALVRCAG